MKITHFINMNEELKTTFDMLVNRLHDIEDRLERSENTAKLNECMKFGQLNNHALGFSFPINRCKSTNFYKNDSIVRIPSYTANSVLIELSFHEDCSCEKEVMIFH